MVHQAHLAEWFSRQKTLHPIDHYLRSPDEIAAADQDNRALLAWIRHRKEKTAKAKDGKD